MKAKLTLLGMVSLVLASCDKKETATHPPEPPKKKSSGFHTLSINDAASKSRSIGKSAAATPQSRPGSGTTFQPAPARPADPERAAMIEQTEVLRQERLARMAKAREERVAQAVVQVTERYKQQDANGDGLLSMEEVNGRTQERFAQNDTNGDGYLDASEQEAMIQSTIQRMSEGRGGRRGGGNNGGSGRGNRGAR